MTSNGFSPFLSGFPAFDSLTMDKCPSLSLASQVHPEPNSVVAACVNFSLKASTDPKSRANASASG
ncbi:unknown [Bacteroides sp. CAG:875]|nr:unknown [Bacteroides sp. CAG:875]